MKTTPLGSQQHNIEECPQAPTLKAHGDMMQYHGDILTRLERHSERQTEALEDIAKQGAMVISHEKRLDRAEATFDVVFQKIRGVDDKYTGIDNRVRVMELKAAEETGIEKVEEEKKRFWTAVKVQNSTPLLVIIFFFFWVLDKWNVFAWLASLFHAMNG